jgi:hypothetical protein
MGLAKSQQILITKARNPGGSELGVFLDDATCAYLTAVIISDLGIAQHFPEIPASIPPFFGSQKLGELQIDSLGFLSLLERLFIIYNDADTYFYCLATLHKARLKYERILQSQAIPTIDQVGPRGLLQYGILSPKSLVALLFWRKWMFDIDNRAGQETGYVFEPIIAYAIGGIPYSAKRSPVKRGGVGSLGRQVDCIIDNRAYEIKIRVTIAASGQGRWGEELDFPKDCQASGFTPVLVVLDPTANVKLEELNQAFIAAGGESYIGRAAWDHLASVAGPTMARFLEIYVHSPLQELLKEALQELPDLTLHMSNDRIIMEIGEEYLTIQRNKTEEVTAENDKLPEDVDEEGPTA